MKRPFLVLAVATLIQGALSADSMELTTLLAEVNARLEWNPERELGVVLIGRDRIVFKLGIPWVIVDYEEKVNIVAPFRENGSIFIPRESVRIISEYLTERRKQRGNVLRVSMILIDPGHGGKDPGTLGEHKIEAKVLRLAEKDIVLELGLLLHGMLQSKYPDKKVLLTRSDDSYLSLEQRVEMANTFLQETQDAIIFISLHANGAFNKAAKGFEVWYLPPEYRRTLISEDSADEEDREIIPILNSMLEEEITIESVTLAQEIAKGLAEKVGKITDNRGIKQETWFVVRNAKLPSVLVEIGFVTNAEEAQKMSDGAYLQQVAGGIYTGACSFIGRYESTKD